MTLPPFLRPWWALFKRLHRVTALCSGWLFRALSPLLGARGVPVRATLSSRDTAAREPAAVTLHAGRPASQLLHAATPGTPPGHAVFERGRAVSVPATFTLEIRGGRLSGDFGATTTPGKTLDYETSTYFGITGWREHPIFLRPTLGRTEEVAGTVLSLTARGTATNYYHFLYDAIARYGIFRECLPDLPVDAVVVAHQARYQRELLALAGVPGRLVQPVRGRTVAAGRLLVPSNPNWALQAPPSVVDWLRQRLRPSGPVDMPRRLYLTRGDRPHTRCYVQEAQLWPELERRGFVRLDPGAYSVQEQIDIFHQAEVIVSPHGAALTNVTFSPEGVRVLELFAATYVHLGLWSICRSIGADYRYLVAETSRRPGRRNAGVYEDVSIPVERVLAEVDALLA